MKVFALGTHSDWVYNGGVWGRPGHQRIADLTYAAGIRRLYWRTHNGGQAKYPSKVCRVSDGEVFRDPGFRGLGTLPKSYFAYAQYLDYRKWDQVADMVEIGSRVGLEVCHWYTIFEDDHGGHLASDFLHGHPEFRCVLRNGEPVPGCLDFWFPEVRAYKLAILGELLERPVPRILLDFLRRNGRPSADAQGNYHYGFNPEILEGFRGETGLDARRIAPESADWKVWLDYNARPITEFLRDAKALAAAKGVVLDLLTWAVDPLRWQALDVAGAAREGLFENLLTGTQRYAFSGANARQQVAQARDALHGVPATVLPGLFAYHGIPPRTVDDFIEGAEAVGCEAVVLHESNHVIESPISDRLRAWAHGVPHSRRVVPAAPEGAIARLQSGFLKSHDIEGAPCDQLTEFTAAWTPRELQLTVICHERNPSALLPVQGIGVENFNGNALKARAFWNPYESIHLFLDASHGHEDYFHFVLDPSGALLSERRLDEDWEGKWGGTASIEPDRWIAAFTLPWGTLGVEPETGRTLGFHLVRIQNSPREVSSWFCATNRRVNPLEFGHLRLE